MTERTNTNEKTSDICRRMSELRSSLGDDVEEMVESARTLTDWRHYVKTYPWLCLATAGAIGFLAVPKRVEIVRPTADALEELAKRNKLVVNTDAKAEARSGLGGVIIGLVANALVRGVTGYVAQNASKIFNGILSSHGQSQAAAESEERQEHEKSTR